MDVQLHALRMLKLDVYHIHDLGHTSCNAVAFISCLLHVPKDLSGRCQNISAVSKKKFLFTSPAEVSVKLGNPIPSISQPMLEYKCSLHAER